MNHRQELLYALLGITAIPLLAYWTTLSRERQNRFALYAIVAFSLSLGFGWIAKSYYPAAFGVDAGAISRFGTFRLWSADYRFYQDTLGVHGWVALLLAAIFFRRRPLVYGLSLLPVATLLFPPAVIAYAHTFPTVYLTFRMLYAFPLSIALCAGILDLTSSLGRKFVPEAIAATVILLLSLCPEHLWRGRLWFQFHKPVPERTLLSLDQTADWFMKNRDVKKLRYCSLVSDNATSFYLGTQLGLNEWYFGGEATRRAKKNLLDSYPDTESIVQAAKIQNPFCGVLVANRGAIPPTPPSRAAELSGHWLPEHGDLNWYQTEKFESAANGLKERGWTVTPVPPFYTLYEPKN